jgi:hypothetical protein
LRIPCLLAIVAITVTCGAHSGLVDQSVGPVENLNRFVMRDGTLAISRPDESWKFEVDESEPHVVARISSPDEVAVADIQVQHVPGATLAQLKEPIEQAIAAEVQGFNKLSGRDLEIRGIAAYELAFTVTEEGTLHKAKMLVYKPDDTLYIVKCRSPAEEWSRFESEFDTVLASFEFLPEQDNDVWGRRIKWEAETGPEAREHASFILDPDRDRAVMLLGSGYQPYLDPLGDAWAFDLNKENWSGLTLEGDRITPGGSRRAARIKGGAFIHGGYGKEMSESQDLWKLQFEDTTVKVTLVEQENAPMPRVLHGFAVDTTGDTFVIFGGGSSAGTLDDTWIGTKSERGVRWRKLDLDLNPDPRYGFSYAHDEENGRLIVCSGQISSADGAQVDAFALDIWALNFTADEPEWTLLAEYDTEEFPGRRNPAFTFDQRSGDLFVWGGAAAEMTVLSDLFIIRTREDGAPVQRVSRSARIPTRASSFGVVDPKRSRALMGFGNIAAGPFLDLVEVKLRQWPPARAQSSEIVIIDFYGIRSVSEDKVRQSLGLVVGDSLPDDTDPILERLRRIPGVEQATLNPVCCVDGKRILFVGIEETGVERPKLRARPEEDLKLPPEFARIYQAEQARGEAAAQEGRAGDDWSQGHSLSEDPDVRALQLRFVELSGKHLQTLRRVLALSRHDEDRRVAAAAIAYAADKKAILPDLVRAARDPDDDVRNNAMRAIAVMAAYAQDHPELGIEIDYTPFVEMLNSPIWSDRNKALAIIQSLASGGDQELLRTLREEAFDSLLEMARWQSSGHAFWAFFTLGHVLGLNEDDIHERWTDENRTAWLDEIGQAKAAGGHDDL